MLRGQRMLSSISWCCLSWLQYRWIYARWSTFIRYLVGTMFFPVVHHDYDNILRWSIGVRRGDRSIRAHSANKKQARWSTFVWTALRNSNERRCTISVQWICCETRQQTMINSFFLALCLEPRSTLVEEENRFTREETLLWKDWTTTWHQVVSKNMWHELSIVTVNVTRSADEERKYPSMVSEVWLTVFF